MADVRGLSVRQRLALCRDLLTVRAKLAGVPEKNRIKAEVMAKRRAAAIRKVLLGRDGASLTDALLSPAAMADAITAALNAVKDAPQHERDAEVVYAQSIVTTMRVIASAEGRLGMGDTDDGKLLQKAIEDAGFDSYLSGFAEGVLDAHIAAGKLPDDVHEELKVAAAGGTEADHAVSEATRALARRHAALAERARELRNAAILAHERFGYDSLEYAVARAAWDKFDTEELAPAEGAVNEVAYEPIKRAKVAFARVGAKVIAGLLEASPIAVDEAERWAEAQEVTKAARTRLGKLGYPLAQVRADLAEFCRLTGGRVQSVRIDSNGSRRANATDIEAHGQVGTINLGSSFDKRVLWHELAHHMESDPVAKAASGRFIRRRSVDGDTRYSLQSLTGNTGYRKNEAAYKDHFFDPYVGKVYSSGITEVFSMGVESFSNPELLARRLAVDPEHLAYIAGFMKAKPSPLSAAHAALHEILREMNDEAVEASGDALANQLKALASSTKLVPDSDIAWAGALDWMLRSYGKQVGRLVGPSGATAYLFSGMVRNYDHGRRKVAGLTVVWRARQGEVYCTNLPTRDKTYALAALALYERDGVAPSWHKLNDLMLLRGK